MIVFPCQNCSTSLSADPAQAGQWVRCPICGSTMRTPAASSSQPPTAFSDSPVAPPEVYRNYSAQLPSPRTGGRRYGFNCGYCSSRLEATEAMAAQQGQCPTCGSQITIPILDRYGRLIDPHTRPIIKQDPHPVHAYAAAGERAPKILRYQDGSQAIQCPRCQGNSPISANNCKLCGMPFTMEGTTVEAAGGSNGFCVASLVLGIISLPAFCTVVAPILAVIFGIVGYNQVSASGNERSGKGMAIAGIICGTVGGLLAAATYLRIFD